MGGFVAAVRFRSLEFCGGYATLAWDAAAVVLADIGLGWDTVA